ncbi:hypothetical protein HanIR_Chr15g0746881 [Helianthus annuus]|nr:hypothetical protein HanIR_Chr15g0746881 [Helianthus annuus]
MSFEKSSGLSTFSCTRSTNESSEPIRTFDKPLSDSESKSCVYKTQANYQNLG